LGAVALGSARVSAPKARHDAHVTSDGGRSILAEEVKTEIYDGATPYWTYVRGMIVDGDRGVLLTGNGDGGAVVIEG
jgi:hypothetical protein